MLISVRMRRLICAFVVCIGQKQVFLMVRLLWIKMWPSLVRFCLNDGNWNIFYFIKCSKFCLFFITVANSKLVLGLYKLLMSLVFLFSTRKIKHPKHWAYIDQKDIWATAQQNQQNHLCAQRNQISLGILPVLISLSCPPEETLGP